MRIRIAILPLALLALSRDVGAQAAAELQLGESAMRVETRGNVFCHYAPERRGSAQPRCDVTFMVGYAHHFR